MKKAFILLCLAAGLLSCAKEIAPQEETKGVPMTFEFSVDGQTKASKTAWTDIDVIYVFFKGLETKHLMLTYDSATQKWTPHVEPGDASLTDEDFDGLTEHTLTAVYYPTPVYVTYDAEKGFFNIDTDAAGTLCYNYYLFEEDKAYEVEGTTVTARIALAKAEDFVQIHLPCNTTEVGGTFGCSLIRPVACAGVGVDGKIIEKKLQAGARLKGIADADGLLFAGRLTSPGTAEDYTFTFATDNEIYTLLRDSKTLEAGKQYNFPALSETDWTVTDAADLYVDLGLSVKWAKCNLGAATEEDYGDYFAWAEIQPKDDYSWSTYAWMKEGRDDWQYITKYTIADGRTVGIWYEGETFVGDGKTSLADYDYADDAAYAALGGKFRMPTKAEMTELKSDCTWTYEESHNGTGIKGFLVTSKKEGYTDKSIFIPLAGAMSGGTHMSDAAGKSVGVYFSGSLDETNLSGAWAMQILDHLSPAVFSGNRPVGFSIRPVCQ